MTIGLVLAGTMQAKPLDIWISSYQDQLYYESMVKLYKAKVDKAFEAKVQSFGFREMPEKLAVSIKTGINPPDVVQLDEVLFGPFLSGDVPFVDLNARIKKAKLDKDIAKSRQSLFAYKGKTYGIPQSLSAMVLYYRTDLFKELGIDPATARRAVAEVFDEVDEASVLERAIAKRLDGPIRDRAQFRRLYQALLRQGFPPDRVAAALVVRSEGHVGMEE